MKKIKLFILTIVVALTSYGFTTYKNDFFEIAKQIEIFTNLYKEINMNYVDEVNPAALMNTAIEAMLNDLDPYTIYWNEQEIQNARIQNSGNYTGIGAEIISTPESILIRNIQKGSPADIAGLKIGDKIISIGDIQVEDYNEDAGELLKGSADTEVILKVNRNSEVETMTLVRGMVEEKAVPFFKLLKNNTGYIVLSQFSRSASSEVIEAFQRLKEEGATQIILDLRNNPGGLLSEAVNVSNIFIEKGTTITFTKSAIEKYNQTYATQNKALDTEIPLTILINENSASASEIVSGSLQDLDRAVVIGSRSFGKGLVQRPKKLNYGTQAKITISRYYTPSGRCIQALDYMDGESIRKEKNEYTEFKTKSGRSVYDGGGIKPDIVVDVEKESKLVKALKKENVIFDFSVNYISRNRDLKLENFKFNQTIIDDFKKFIKENNFKFETDTDKKIDELKDIAESEDYLSSIQSSLIDLQKELNKEKEEAFQKETQTLKKLITENILRIIGYDDAVYTYYTEKGEVIDRAISLLNNKNSYKEILGYN
ncbi:S41 family peptidase [Psychroflexus sediminis]|uniref:Carboxyl-terminal processing protease n=1 Tax=Psychroflexus sediminis TaxID=470826 RepID=A0A1G7YEH4_9FLAO|nr:S41 family peptidase [Psychroflexus sediminis]SDG94745.1 carboxyl-terminal processing protease [Psychroflexus sediminis]